MTGEEAIQHLEILRKLCEIPGYGDEELTAIEVYLAHAFGDDPGDPWFEPYMESIRHFLATGEWIR